MATFFYLLYYLYNTREFYNILSRIIGTTFVLQPSYMRNFKLPKKSFQTIFHEYQYYNARCKFIAFLLRIPSFSQKQNSNPYSLHNQTFNSVFASDPQPTRIMLKHSPHLLIYLFKKPTKNKEEVSGGLCFSGII